MTAFNFTPTATAPYQFQPTLDGALYTARILWNIFGQRWYLNLFANNGNRVLTIPVVASPRDYPISLTKGYFNSTLVFYEDANTFEVLP